jgi:hypothetical protein
MYLNFICNSCDRVKVLEMEDCNVYRRLKDIIIRAAVDKIWVFGVNFQHLRLPTQPMLCIRDYRDYYEICSAVCGTVCHIFTGDLSRSYTFNGFELAANDYLHHFTNFTHIDTHSSCGNDLNWMDVLDACPPNLESFKYRGGTSWQDSIKRISRLLNDPNQYTFDKNSLNFIKLEVSNLTQAYMKFINSRLHNYISDIH